MTYQEAIAYIHSIQWRGSRLGLSRIRELLERLGNPQKQLKFVHVAGTNGKGSTCAMIASVMTAAGYRTGLFTSPYVYDFNERFQIDGEMISEEELAGEVERIRPAADSMEDPPTEFELITAVGMDWFLRRKCDIVVLEVGLGGEMDSTNVIDTPELAVITPIDYDHTQILGGTIVQIASAKAGIIKPGGDVVISGKSREALAVFQMKTEQMGGRLFRPRFDALIDQGHVEGGRSFTYAAYEDLVLPLVGKYQLDNAALAITALEILMQKGWNIPEEAVRRGLASLRWPGRYETIFRSPTVILDVSHNPQGIRATAETLREDFPGKKIVFVFGVLVDKDYRSMMAEILFLAKELIIIGSNGPRAMAADTLAGAISHLTVTPVHAAATMEDACERALRAAGEDGVICVLGSFTILADARKAFTARLKKEEHDDGA